MAKLIDTVHDDWKPLIQKHLLTDKVRYCLNLYKAEHLAPSMGNVFKAYTLPKDKIKIAMVGLSPYFTIFQHNGKSHLHATGLAMGVPPYTITLPPTLSELEYAVHTEWIGDISTPYHIDKTLQTWHEQGIMLLNAGLTSVLGHDARIHLQYWKDLIAETLQELIHTNLFVLYGSEAAKFTRYINPIATVFDVPHPVKYKRTGMEYDRLAGKGVFDYIKKNFPEIQF
jgi:uracil DNA glycosylase